MEKVMGWVVFLSATLVIAAALFRFAPDARRHWTLVAAALLCGLGGYAWQGSPGQPASPAVSRMDGAAPTSVRSPGMTLPANFSSEGEYLGYADAMLRMGRSSQAANLLSTGVGKYPQNADLWVGLANALTVHSNGVVSPAARFALEKALRIAPGHFGAAFLVGLGLAQQEKLEDARTVWADMLARSPADAPWRADLDTRIKAIDGVLAEQLQGQ